MLYPEQDRRVNPQGCWHWYDTRNGLAQAEAATVLAAIDQVGLLYPVDLKRVAIAGMSAGAGLAALLASRHPERFRAVVMHSGVPPGAAQSGAGVLRAMGGRHTPQSLPEAGTAWPPLLVIQGSDDLVVASANAQAAAQLWAEAAGALPGTTRRVQRGQRLAMDITDHKRRGRTVATQVEVQGLGHAWSGGDARQPFSDERGPDATRMLWAFAERQWRVKR